MNLPFALARRFVASETLAGALPVVKQINQDGLSVALDMLGEYVTDREVADQATADYIALIESLDDLQPLGADRVHPSIKLSMIGQHIDPSYCLDNLTRVMEAAKSRDLFVCFDMEGTDLTESTLSIFEKVHPDFPDNCGVVLQAYLHRTAEDVARMSDLGARVRLCKGAYKEPESIAYQSMEKIRERYMDYIGPLLQKGTMTGVATHDDLLIDAVAKHASDHAISADSFEYQMLFGIRSQKQRQILAEGNRMRVYVPYGTQWFPYFTRRLRERKENVWFVLKNLFES